MMSPSIIIRQLSTGYGSTVITPAFDAVLPSGALTCLLGLNGSGKSTLLRTVAGLQPPLGGEIVINNKPSTAYNRVALARRLSVVLTDRIDQSNTTVRELVAMGRAPYTSVFGSMSATDNVAVDRAMELTGVSCMASRRLSSLSDGERQKVMIAKSLAQDTQIILLDEPTAFLDFPSKVDMMNLLATLARSEGKTIMLSTHDLELALQMTDNVWLIDKQLGVTTGSCADLSADGTVSRYFDRVGLTYNRQMRTFVIDR